MELWISGGTPVIIQVMDDHFSIGTHSDFGTHFKNPTESPIFHGEFELRLDILIFLSLDPSPIKPAKYDPFLVFTVFLRPIIIATIFGS